MSKNIATHVISAAVVLAVGFGAGNTYHHQNVVARQRHIAAVAAAQKAAAAKHAAEVKAAQEAAAKAAAAAATAKVKPSVQKATVYSTTR